jgi:hypothetical protein
MSALGRPATHRVVAYLTPERATVPTRATSATPQPGAGQMGQKYQAPGLARPCRSACTTNRR